MLSRFLDECSVIRTDEIKDFKLMYNKLANKVNFTSLMPSRALDLFPAYVIQSYADFINPDNISNVYFISLSENGYMGAIHMEDILYDLYINKKVSEDILKYNIKLDKTILLSHPIFDRTININGVAQANVVYQSYILENGKEIHAFYIPSSPDFLYERILEFYRIELDMLIDYKHGLGVWNDKNPLFTKINDSKYRYICPKYFFKEYEEYFTLYDKLIFRKNIEDNICEIYRF